MIIAISTYQNRIAPVFDVASRVLVIERIEKGAHPKNQKMYHTQTPEACCELLKHQQVTILLCGAISKEVQEIIERAGILVIPFLSGSVQEIIDAWRYNQEQIPSQYYMPGCTEHQCRHQRTRRQHCCHNKPGKQS